MGQILFFQKKILFRIFQFAKKMQKKNFAPKCAPIFDPLPRAQKSKLGRTKKYTPGEFLIDPINTKIKIRTPQMGQNARPKVAV